MAAADVASTLELVRRMAVDPARPLVVDPAGTWSGADLLAASERLAGVLLGPRADLDGERVVVLAEPGHEFDAALLAVWRAGGLAVPLHPGHPAPELEGLAAEAGARRAVSSAAHQDLARALLPTDGVVVPTATPVVEADLPLVDEGRPALMIFTSGTTGRPKGVVHTHASLRAMVEGMVGAWGWRGDDRALLVLPLHHVHGLVNVVVTGLWVGATVEAPGGFDAVATWERLASGEVTVLMAVPTIYARLVAAWEAADDATRRRWSDGARRVRLMVSGSAALPVPVLERWRELTGHVLLERYGMSELGMVLSNRLDRRVPGHVGDPLPGVEVRVVDDAGADLPDGESGELWVRGPQVFAGYWERPDATTESFVDGWFRTGDVGVRTPEGYRLLGRSSVDILKSGGEKVSALEIEDAYRAHPDVADCAVVGVPDAEWGDRVAMAVVPAPGRTPDPAALRAWGKERLAPAKVPAVVAVVDDLPRNAMGKVTKAAVRAGFEGGR